MLRVVFIEQFYYPEGWGGAQLPRDLTSYLARHGFDVQVICGRDQYVSLDEDSVDDPREAGVSIRRIPRIIGGKFQTMKFLRQLWFYIVALPLLIFRRSPDVFVTQTNPPLAVSLVALAAILHRRPFVIITQDLYPEVVFAHAMLRPGSLTGQTLSWLFRWAYSRARHVVSLGPTMSKRLIEKGVASERIVRISNWSTGSQAVIRGANNRLREKWGLQNNFVLLYSGNIGISHDVETPISAMREILLDTLNIKMVFIGKGSRLAEAEQLVRVAGIEHAVQFRPFVSSSLMPQSLGLANLALVTLREGFQGLVVPSKSLSYMARGIPMLYVGPASDVQQLIVAAGSGLCVENGDVHGLATALRRAIADREMLQQMGINGKRYYDEKLAQTIGLESYHSLLWSVTEAPGVFS